MAANAKYTILSDPNYHLQSVVSSYGIDHTTEKDLRSFYTNVSQLSYIDTGLLPVFGSGMLSLRGAGGHYQVAYQHAPNKYLINWGAYESDPNAKSYLLAQPYRIVIIDIVDNSIYGARHFYSPYPISHIDAPLYHVNLPNLNCKGYTNGVGVGWICLYHKSESSNISDFSELLRIGLERTSGVEPYNDRNMAETDGIRFYREHYNNDENYAFLWNPKLWEEKTEQEGIAWTLDENLWAPIKVHSLDDQACHYPHGEEYTFAHAILGNYKAYYYDDNVPKLVNIISREDFQLSSSTIYTLFTKAHNSTSLYDSSTEPEKPPTFKTPSLFVQNNNEEDDESFICDCCSDTYSLDEHISTADGYSVCNDCSSEIFYVDHLQEYFYHDNNLIFDTNTSSWYNLDFLKAGYHYYLCEDCGSFHFDQSTIFNPGDVSVYMYSFPNKDTEYSITKPVSLLSSSFSIPNYWQSSDTNDYYCSDCLEKSYTSDSSVEINNCDECGCFIPNPPNTDAIFEEAIPVQNTNVFHTYSISNLASQNSNCLYEIYNDPRMKDKWFSHCPSCRVKVFNKFYEKDLEEFISHNIVNSSSKILENLMLFGFYINVNESENDILNSVSNILSQKVLL